jgi:hypothetical protein
MELFKKYLKNHDGIFQFFTVLIEKQTFMPILGTTKDEN